MINVLYEDASIIVVWKPVGMESQSARGFAADMVSEIQKHIHNTSTGTCGKASDIHSRPANIHNKSTKPTPPYVGVIHRLDKPVSGVMVYAKDKNAAAALSRQVQDHKMQKKYLAVLCGKPVDNVENYVDYLLKDDKANVSRIVDKDVDGAKRAELSVKVLENVPEILREFGTADGAAHGAEVHGAEVHGAEVRGAEVHGAEVHGAEVHGAEVHGAEVHGAEVHGAEVHGAEVRGAEVHGAEVHGAEVCGAEAGSELTLVEVTLKTGRHHQIRVQMAGHGTPIWGDNRYNPVFGGTFGSETVRGRQNCMSETVSGAGVTDACGMTSLGAVRPRPQRGDVALAAYQLSFDHPVTGKRMTFEKVPEGSIFRRFDWIRAEKQKNPVKP